MTTRLDRAVEAARKLPSDQQDELAAALEAAVANANAALVQDWQIAGIKEAIAAADRGEVVSDREISDWIATLGTDNERPKPTR